MQDVTRAPTADEQGGMDWWNAQSEQLRSYWLKEVGSTTASAADAWLKFKAARDLSEKLYGQRPLRMHSGLEFVGFEFSLGVFLGDDGWLGV